MSPDWEGAVRPPPPCLMGPFPHPGTPTGKILALESPQKGEREQKQGPRAHIPACHLRWTWRNFQGMF